MTYMGYSATGAFDADAEVLHGELVGLRDVITFQATSVEGLEEAFRDAVDDYLAWCAELGQEPGRAYAGRFLVRMEPDLHSDLAVAAERADETTGSRAGSRGDRVDSAQSHVPPRTTCTSLPRGRPEQRALRRPSPTQRGDRAALHVGLVTARPRCRSPGSVQRPVVVRQQRGAPVPAAAFPAVDDAVVAAHGAGPLDGIVDALEAGVDLTSAAATLRPPPAVHVRHDDLVARQDHRHPLHDGALVQGQVEHAWG